jgi:hypothetical protein
MLLISANPMSARNVNVSLCACRRRCQSSPSTIPAANSPEMTGRCQRRGNASSGPMIDTREIIANVAKLIPIISGVGPNN